MIRVAAVDVGTNSVRLIVADAGTVQASGTYVQEPGRPPVVTPMPAGPLIDVYRPQRREMQITRLGEGVDATRRLGEEPMRRTAAAIEMYVHAARAARAERIRIAATSAVRDATNRDEFCDLVYSLTRQRVEVISGGEEARLSFEGAIADIVHPSGGTSSSWPRLVLDIGGGSTEFVAGDDEVHAWTSIDVGSVRLTERHVRSDPPGVADLRAVRADADAATESARSVVGPALARLGGYRNGLAELVGVAGTITSMAAVALGLDSYDRERIHRSHHGIDTVRRVGRTLASMTSEQRRALPAMPRGREDVIVAGAVILESVMDGFGIDEVTVSESDILDGLALSLVR